MEDLKQKVERYLDGICDGFAKSKGLHSTYYVLPHNSIRLSNHTTKELNKHILNILCPINDENIIIVFMSQLKVINSYKKFTEFIKTAIWMIRSIENNYITNRSALVPKIKEPEKFDMEGLTPKQQRCISEAIQDPSKFIIERIENYKKGNKSSNKK